MVVSASCSVDIYKYNNERKKYTHNQALSFIRSHWRRASITSDHQYLVINDEITLSDYRIYIYTFNNSTQQFDEPANKEKFKFSSSAGYGSLSSDKKDQFILNPIL